MFFDYYRGTFNTSKPIPLKSLYNNEPRKIFGNKFFYTVLNIKINFWSVRESTLSVTRRDSKRVRIVFSLPER